MASPGAVREAASQRTKSRQRTGAVTGIGVAAALLALSACGSGDTSAGTGTASSAVSQGSGSQGSALLSAPASSVVQVGGDGSDSSVGDNDAGPTGGMSQAGAGAAPVSGATVVDSAWLSSSQLPIGTGLQWQGGPATPQVNANAVNNLGSCLTGNPAQVGAGAQWQTEGGIFHQAGSTQATYQVEEVQYFYAGASAAAQGLSAIESAYEQCKQAASREAGVVDTITVTQRSADTFAVLRTVRTSSGAPTSTATVGSDSHEYVVQDGNVVYFVGFYGDSGIDGTRGDAGLLTQMLTALADYQQ